MAKGKYFVSSDTIYTIGKDNKRVLKEKTLEAINDEIAECHGGYSICREGFILWDDQGVKVLATVMDTGGGARVFDFQVITD